MRGVKVKGHASMMRSSSCPGMIICTDHQAGQAALMARQRNEERESLIEEQQSEIERLHNIVDAIKQHLGIDFDIPEGGGDVK